MVATREQVRRDATEAFDCACDCIERGDVSGAIRAIDRAAFRGQKVNVLCAIVRAMEERNGGAQ